MFSSDERGEFRGASVTCVGFHQAQGAGLVLPWLEAFGGPSVLTAAMKHVAMSCAFSTVPKGSRLPGPIEGTGHAGAVLCRVSDTWSWSCPSRPNGFACFVFMWGSQRSGNMSDRLLILFSCSQNTKFLMIKKDPLFVCFSACSGGVFLMIRIELITLHYVLSSLWIYHKLLATCFH